MEQTLTTILVAELTGLESTGETGGAISDKTLEDHLVAVDRIVTDHHGKLLGNAGGSLAAQFSNPSDAVRCAIVLEETIRSSANDQSIRIGIDQGEVAIENGRVRGDGIKSATALQKRFEGIVISRSVQGQLGDDVGVAVEELSEGGDVAYRVRAKDTGVDAATPPATFRQVLPKFTLVAGGALVLILIVSFAIQDQFSYDFEPADLTKYKFELPEKPSIAVLPFDNLSGDASFDYIGDGLTENIIATLAQVPKLFVIARNSVFTYKGRPTKVQEVAEQLGVRYVLEGSIQKEGSRTRVVAQLVDALDAKHLWAERYDYEFESIFELQDAIALKILEEMEVKLTIGEQARGWQNRWADIARSPEEFRMAVNGRAVFQQWTIDGHLEVERLWGELYRRYPDTSVANNLMGWLYYQKFILRLTDNPADAFAEARRFANEMVRVSNGEYSSDARNLLGTLDLLERKHDSAVAHVDESLKVGPNSSDAHNIGGWIMTYSGFPEKGVELIKTGMRLEPLYSLSFAGDLARALMKLGRYGEARAIAQSVLDRDIPGTPRLIARYQLTAISVWENDLPAAREHVRELLKLEPNANREDALAYVAHDKDRDFVERYSEAMRRAGFPQHPPNSNDG